MITLTGTSKVIRKINVPTIEVIGALKEKYICNDSRGHYIKDGRWKIYDSCYDIEDDVRAATEDEIKTMKAFSLISFNMKDI